jgi:hypothetical protein
MPDSEEKLVGHDAVRRGDRIAGNNQFAAHEDFPEEAAGDVDQIQRAGDTRIQLRGVVDGPVGHAPPF